MVTTAHPRKQKLPTTFKLAIELPFDLVGGERKRVDQFHRRCRQFENQVDLLQLDANGLLSGGMQRPLEQVLEDSQLLRERRYKLGIELRRLRWERFDILPDLIEPFQEYLKQVKADREEIIEQQMARMRERGVDEIAMPSGKTNLTAAALQLRNLVRGEEPVLVANGVLNRVQGVFEALCGQIRSVPTEPHCRVEFEALPPMAMPVEIFNFLLPNQG